MTLEEIEKILDKFVIKLKDKRGLYNFCQATTSNGTSTYNSTDNGEFKKSIELYEEIKKLKPFDKYENIISIIYTSLDSYSQFRSFCERD